MFLDAMDFQEFVRLSDKAASMGLFLNYHYGTDEAKDNEEPDEIIVEKRDRSGFVVSHGDDQWVTNAITFDIAYPERVDEWLDQYKAAK